MRMELKFAGGDELCALLWICQVCSLCFLSPHWMLSLAPPQVKLLAAKLQTPEQALGCGREKALSAALAGILNSKL